MQLNNKLKPWFLANYKPTELQTKVLQQVKARENTFIIASTGFGL